MKTYKYYVHGKPKTFDLTSLTPEELEKFKAMNNTERLRFIELHHLENIPLWEQIDLKTSTKLSDEGETDRKNKQKYSELFRAKNIKNQLEQMKKDGIKEPTDEDIKKVFNDFETQDITQAKNKGYTDIDSLINYYVNKIETLNVDSIDTLKAKEIQNLEAKNISKISIGLEGLKSVADTYKAIQEELNKHKEPVDKKAVANAILADKEFIKELTSKTEKALNVNVSKDDLAQILNESGLINEIIKEVKDKINTVEALTIKLKDEEVKGLIKEALKEYTSKQLTAEQVKNIIKDNVKSLDEEKINQFLSDTGAIKAVMDELKNTVADVELRQKDINAAIDNLKITTADANELMGLIKEYQNGLITKDELKALMEEITKGKLSPEQIEAIMKNSNTIENLAKYLSNINQSLTSLTEIKNYISQLQKKGLGFEDLYNELLPQLNEIIKNYGFNDGKGKKYKDANYLKYRKDGVGDILGDILYPLDTDNDAIKNSKILYIIHNSNELPYYSGSNSIEVKAREYRKFLMYINSIFSKFDEYNNYFKQQGQGLEYDESSEDLEGSEGGKFLNRFKDFEPDIKRLEGMIKEKEAKLLNQLELLKGNIKDIYSELKELKQMKVEARKEESKPFKPNFLNDISKPKNLKPTETKIYKPEDLEDLEHKDLKDILRRRREDIEPDEIEEEEDVDWGEGINDKEQSKVIKFKALMKMLK